MHEFSFLKKVFCAKKQKKEKTGEKR